MDDKMISDQIAYGIGDLRGKKVVNVSRKNADTLEWKFYFAHTDNTLLVRGKPLSIVHFYSMYCDVEFSDVALSVFENEWREIIKEEANQ